MLRFRRAAAFDGAISVLTSFGYFDDRKDDVHVLHNLHASLKPGGRIVVDTVGKEFLARSFCQKHWQETRQGRYWLVEREFLPGMEKIHTHWLFVGGGETREFTFAHRIYSAVELADLLEKTGFCEISVYGDLDGSPIAENQLVLLSSAAS
jgi:hypothetical protein